MKTAREFLDERAANDFAHSGRLGGSFSGLDRIPYVMRDAVSKIMDDYADIKVKNKFQDTEADGIVFCGKCGKQK